MNPCRDDKAYWSICPSPYYLLSIRYFADLWTCYIILNMFHLWHFLTKRAKQPTGGMLTEWLGNSKDTLEALLYINYIVDCVMYL